MDIREIKDPDSEFARQAFAIYEQSFPEEERDPVQTIVGDMRRWPAGDSLGDRVPHFWIVVDDGTVAGFVMFTYYRDLGLACISYMAVRAGLQGQGIGSSLVERLMEQLPRDAEAWDGDGLDVLGACFEVQRPEDALDEVERKLRERRIQFYQRNGAQLITQIEFEAPPVAEGLPSFRYYLMFRPVGASPVSLTEPLLHAILETVLLREYRLEPDDPYFQRAVASIR